MHPPICSRGAGVEPLSKFSKRGGLTGSQTLEGGCWERGGILLSILWEFTEKCDF